VYKSAIGHACQPIGSVGKTWRELELRDHVINLPLDVDVILGNNAHVVIKTSNSKCNSYLWVYLPFFTMQSQTAFKGVTLIHSLIDYGFYACAYATHRPS